MGQDRLTALSNISIEKYKFLMKKLKTNFWELKLVEWFSNVNEPKIYSTYIFIYLSIEHSHVMILRAATGY